MEFKHLKNARHAPKLCIQSISMFTICCYEIPCIIVTSPKDYFMFQAQVAED
jgi:hypothetical protein